MVTYFFKPKALPSRSFKRYLLVMPVHHQCPQRSFDFGSHVDARDCRSKMMSKKLYTRCLAQANSDSFYRFIQSSWWTHDVRVQVPSAPLLSPEVSPQAKWKPALQIGTGTVKCPNAVMLSKCCPNVVQMLSKCCPSTVSTFDGTCWAFWSAALNRRHPTATLGEAPVATPSPNVLVTQHSDAWDSWGTCGTGFIHFHIVSRCFTFHIVSHRFTSHRVYFKMSRIVPSRCKASNSRAMLRLQVLDALLIELNELLEKVSQQRAKPRNLFIEFYWLFWQDCLLLYYCYMLLWTLPFVLWCSMNAIL